MAGPGAGGKDRCQELAEARAGREFHEFLGAFAHWVHTVERVIPRIARQPRNQEAQDALVETAAGARRDAELCHCAPVLELLRAVESVAEALRDHHLSFVPGVGEVILLAFDRARVVAAGHEAGRVFDAEAIDRITRALADAASAGDQGRDAAIERIITALAGDDWPAATASEPSWPGAPGVTPIATPVGSRGPQAAIGPRGEDLRSFRELSLRLEGKSPFWAGRTDRLIRFALEANAEAGRIVDPAQLEAAVYMHDVGMAFLSEAFWRAEGPLGEPERRELHDHPALAAGLLARLEHWGEATAMVAQHHERPDGRGYPRGLKEAEIAPGARLLALLDAFEAMTHQRVDRPNRKSVMRAMVEINASVDQFARDWVKIFNRVVQRILIEAQPSPPAPRPSAGPG